MIVSLFSEIPKCGNTLYVFDIDETTLYYNFRLDDHTVKIIEDFEAKINPNNKDFFDMNAVWEQTLRQHPPIAHDRDGLEDWKKFCDGNGSKIIFLTARFKTVEKTTIFHMQFLYPWVSANDIHMCNGKEKGLVLFDLVTKTDYNTIIFVDDKEYNIRSVEKYIPMVNTYKMIINPDKLQKAGQPE